MFTPELSNEQQLTSRIDELAKRRAAATLRIVEAQLSGDPTGADAVVVASLRDHPTGPGARQVVRLVDSGVRSIGQLADAVIRSETSQVSDDSIGAVRRRLEERLLRRRRGEDVVVPLPWPAASEGFEGGLKPGVHYLIGATGTGKTQVSLSQVLTAARAGIPCLCVGLELGPESVLERLAALACGLRWSVIDHGHTSTEEWDRFSRALDECESLPIYFQDRKPDGVSASDIRARLKAMLEQHYSDDPTSPRYSAPGSSRPSVVVVDFLQLVAPESGSRSDPRERVGAAAYQFRFMAEEEGASVIAICSTSREGSKFLAGGVKALPKGTTLLPGGEVLGASALAVLGKEAGEVEYSADSVTTAFSLGRVDGGELCAFVVGKNRYGKPFWYALHFSGTEHRALTEAEQAQLDATLGKGEPSLKKQAQLDSTLDKGGPRLKKEKSTNPQEEEVVALWNQGMSFSDIATRLALSKRKVQTIKERAEKNGATLRKAVNH